MVWLIMKKWKGNEDFLINNNGIFYFFKKKS